MSTVKSATDTNKELKAWGLLILGSLVFAIGSILFANPYRLAPGGTWGLSTVLNAIHPWKVSAYATCMDIPLLVIGTLILGAKFGVKTIASNFMIIGFGFLLETFWGYFPVIHQGIYESLSEAPEALQSMMVNVEYKGHDGTNGIFYFMPDYMLNTLVAGVIYGLGIGLIFKSGATSGGSDIISMIIHKYTKISLGTLVMIVDGLITFSTMFINSSNATDFHSFTANLRLPLNSIIVVFIEGIMIDLVVDGFKKPKTYCIRTANASAVANFVKNELQSGDSCIEGSDMVIVTLNREKSNRLNQALYNIDQDAFVTVMESKETYGKGMKEIPHETPSLKKKDSKSSKK